MTNTLYVWIEGLDDERFFDRTVRLCLEETYKCVQVVKYAGKSIKWRRSFLKSIAAMGADYLYVSDINSATCVSARKTKLLQTLADLDGGKIIIAAMEIESWYLAGLDDHACAVVGIKPVGSTDSITKEHFNRMIPSRFSSRIDFMLEVLSHFSIDTAKRRNTSFAYFAGRWGF